MEKEEWELRKAQKNANKNIHLCTQLSLTGLKDIKTNIHQTTTTKPLGIETSLPELTK